MRRKWTSPIGRWLATLLLTMVGALLLALPARAAAHTPHAGADTVSLSIDNGTTFTFGETPQPTFTAVVTFGTKPTANYYWTVSVRLEDGATISGGSSPATSPDGMTLTFTRMTPSTTITVGQHTASASFSDPGMGTTVTSNPVSFTVNKATPNLTCSIDGTSANFVGTGQTLHVRMAPTAPTGQVPVDWQDGTYTVTLDGPTHLTIPNLAPDSNDVVTVPGPSQIGKYLLGCAFSGTASFTSVTYSDALPYTFSALNGLGPVELFTNPTTLAAQQKLDFYIVFHAAPGLPTPTGEFVIWMGSSYYTNSLQVGPTGDTLIHLNPLPSLYGVSQITVRYWGDVYYNEATVNFPLTNPPIPAGVIGGSGGNSGGSGSGSFGNNPQSAATATAGGTAGAQATPSAEATSTAVIPRGVASSKPAAPGDNSGPFLMVILALLVLAGLGVAGGVIYLTRRAKSPPGGDSHTAGTAPAPPPASPHHDTMPDALTSR